MFLVAKINDIEVISVEPSKIEIKNNVQRSRKVASTKETSKKTKDKTKEAKQGQGEEHVSSGGGSASYKRIVFAKNREDTGRLQTILETMQEVNVVDPWKGRLTGTIESLSITDSYSNINQTAFEFVLLIKSAEWAPITNYKLLLKDAVDVEKKALLEDVNKLKDAVEKRKEDMRQVSKKLILEEPGLYESFKDWLPEILQGKKGFFSDTINSLAKNLELLYEVKGDVIGFVQKATKLTQQIESIYTSLTDLLNTPFAVWEAMLDVAEGAIGIGHPNRLEKIFEPFLKGSRKKLSDVGPDNLGNIEKENIDFELLGTHIANRVFLIRDTSKLLLGGFKTKKELDELYNSVFERLKHVGDDYIISFEKQNAITQYYNNYDDIDLETKHITKPKPLLRIVFDLYNNIDYVEEIAEINSIPDPDWVSGDLLVYKT